MAETGPITPAAEPLTFDVPEEMETKLPEHLKPFLKDGKLDLTAIDKSQVQARQKISELGEAAKAAGTEQAGDGLRIPDASATGSESMEQLLASMGLSRESIATEYAENNGQLTQDTYLKFQSKNVPRWAVDNSIQADLAEQQSQQTAAATARSQAVELAGGEPQLQALLGWVRSSGEYTEAEITDLNGRINSASLAKRAVSQIMNDHQTALGAGNARPLISGAAAPGGGLRITKSNVKDISKRAAAGDEQAMAAMISAHKTGELAAAKI